MPNTNDDDKNREMTDESISALYQQSRREDASSIPDAIDSAILDHARKVVASEDTASHTNQNDAGKVMLFQRRGWEVPASLAATVVICSSLFLLNQGEITPELDTQTELRDIASPAIHATPQSELARPTANDAATTNFKINSAKLPEHTSAMSDSAEAQTFSVERERLDAQAFTPAPASAPPPKTLESMPAHSEPAQEESTVLDPRIHELARESLQAKSRMPGNTEQDLAEITAREWLHNIKQAWLSGDEDSATSQLREFRIHFPGFSLDKYCEELPDLCTNAESDTEN